MHLIKIIKPYKYLKKNCEYFYILIKNRSFTRFTLIFQKKISLPLKTVKFQNPTKLDEDYFQNKQKIALKDEKCFC